MDARYTIAPARPQDVSRLAAIERAAARLLDGHAPGAVLDEVTSDGDLHEAMDEGRLWVALCEDAPVGFALVEMLAPEHPHFEEMDVHPAHGRRGVGAALARAVCDWTARHGYREITLTTFRDVAWNMPFYARLGFREIPRDEATPELAAVLGDEAARGLASVPPGGDAIPPRVGLIVLGTTSGQRSGRAAPLPAPVAGAAPRQVAGRGSDRCRRGSADRT
jgi:GNAT superfamily N-acetyltransferase